MYEKHIRPENKGGYYEGLTGKSGKINTMFEDKLFPTSIFRTKIPNFKELNPKLENYIYNLRKKHPEDIMGFNETSWHSPDINLSEDLMTEFIYEIDPIIYGIMRTLGWDLEEHYISYTNMWSNINSKYSFNSVHHHGNSHLSIAYYVKIPKDQKGGSIYFKDPRTTSGANIPPTKSFSKAQSIYLSKTHACSIQSYTPNEGDLIVFPSWLEHGVQQSKSDDDRIVISANIKLHPNVPFEPFNFKKALEQGLTNPPQYGILGLKALRNLGEGNAKEAFRKNKIKEAKGLKWVRKFG